MLSTSSWSTGLGWTTFLLGEDKVTAGVEVEAVFAELVELEAKSEALEGRRGVLGVFLITCSICRVPMCSFWGGDLDRLGFEEGEEGVGEEEEEEDKDKVEEEGEEAG